MIHSLYRGFLFLVTIIALSNAQSSTNSDSGYVGYNLTLTGDAPSAVYSTESTPANVSTTFPEPDVFLNASVHVGEIDIIVSNLTAKINLDAEVKQLLQFNAGVDISINRVALLISNVTAKVLLEARLANLVLMVNNVLDSLDLNPVLLTLGEGLESVVNATTETLTSTTEASAVEKRDYNIEHNILYSVNDYSGQTHTNRILSQDGTLVDQSLDNSGNIYAEKVVGVYSQDMTFNGYNQSVVRNGQDVYEQEYVYEPFVGLIVVSLIYTDGVGTVVGAQVIVESGGGGSSTIGGA